MGRNFGFELVNVEVRLDQVDLIVRDQTDDLTELDDVINKVGVVHAALRQGHASLGRLYLEGVEDRVHCQLFSDLVSMTNPNHMART
jgi:hypothetical protein